MTCQQNGAGLACLGLGRPFSTLLFGHEFDGCEPGDVQWMLIGAGRLYDLYGNSDFY